MTHMSPEKRAGKRAGEEGGEECLDPIEICVGGPEGFCFDWEPPCG